MKMMLNSEVESKVMGEEEAEMQSDNGRGDGDQRSGDVSHHRKWL